MASNRFSLGAAARFCTALLALLFLGAPASMAQAPGDDGGLLTRPGVIGSPPPAAEPPVLGAGSAGMQAMQFEPLSPSAAFAHQMAWVYNTGEKTAYLEAWIPIPHGVRINQFVFYYYDNDPAHTAAAHLALYRNDGGGAVYMGTASGSEGAPGYAYAVDATIDSPEVDLAAGMLLAEVILPPSSDVRAGFVRVDYSYNLSLPLVVH